MSSSQIESSCKRIVEHFSASQNQQDPHQDAALKAQVWMALWEADDIKALNIEELEVIVKNCEVWLEGQVTDAQQCKLAEYLVNDINGIREIHNNLSVEPG